MRSRERQHRRMSLRKNGTLVGGLGGWVEMARRVFMLWAMLES